MARSLFKQLLRDHQGRSPPGCEKLMAGRRRRRPAFLFWSPASSNRRRAASGPAHPIVDQITAAAFDGQDPETGAPQVIPGIRDRLQELLRLRVGNMGSRKAGSIGLPGVARA